MEKEAINKAISDATGLHGDFFDNLNAMHEAEKSLSLDERSIYWHWLAHITEKGRIATAAWLTTTATAPQRAEAFLRTKGMWREAVVEGGK